MCSFVYLPADTISDLGFGHELANYGEYSGAPSEEQTYEYAKTIIKLMTSERLPEPSAEPASPAPAAPAGGAGSAGASAAASRSIRGKVLIIGGGIANFTDVAKTFAGIIRALREAAPALLEHKVTVWVRRGGPNYQEGLRLMAELGDEIGVPIHVYGPDTHITAIVPLALGMPDAGGLRLAGETHASGAAHSAVAAAAAAATSGPASGGARARAGSATAAGEMGGIDGPYSGSFALRRQGSLGGSGSKNASQQDLAGAAAAAGASDGSADGDGSAAASSSTPINSLFMPGTRCVVYGMQTRAVQGMLDFDFLCRRSKPSVAAMVFPFSGNHFQKFYWGTSETMLPVYSSTEEALRRHPDVTVFVNFASFRSVHQSTMEALAFAPKGKGGVEREGAAAAGGAGAAAGAASAAASAAATIRTIAIIAEGVPEQQTRLLIREAEDRDVMVIGPATVGGIAAGSFRIGNTGGMLDNIMSCKLYRPGSVGYVSKSGGMSNELNNIMAAYTDGVCEGVAIGGDRYPGSRFLDHLMRYEANPKIKMMVLLGVSCRCCCCVPFVDLLSAVSAVFSTLLFV